MDWSDYCATAAETDAQADTHDKAREDGDKTPGDHLRVIEAVGQREPGWRNNRRHD